MARRKKFSNEDIAQIEKLFRLKKNFPDKKQLERQRKNLWSRLDNFVNDLYPTLVADEKFHVDRKQEKKAFTRIKRLLDSTSAEIEKAMEIRPDREIIECAEEQAREEILYPGTYAPAEVLAEYESEYGVEIDTGDPLIDPVLRGIATYYEVPLANLVAMGKQQYFSEIVPVSGFPNLYLPRTALQSMLKLYVRGLERVEQEREADITKRDRQRTHPDTITRERSASELARIWDAIAQRKITFSLNGPFVKYFQTVYSYLSKSSDIQPSSIKRALKSQPRL